MKTITYFKAYVQCRDGMTSAVFLRKTGETGIAVENDLEALRWQRFDRLARKLRQKIETRFAEANDEQ